MTGLALLEWWQLGDVRRLPWMQKERKRAGGWDVLSAWISAGLRNSKMAWKCNPVQNMWSSASVDLQLWGWISLDIENVGERKPMEYPVTLLWIWFESGTPCGRESVEAYTSVLCASSSVQEQADEAMRGPGTCIARYNGRVTPEMLIRILITWLRALIADE